MQIILSRNRIAEQHLEFQQGSYLIGRSSRCNIVLEGRKVSREHARLTVKRNSYIVEDLNSSVGTFSNGKKIKKASFVNDRTFQIDTYDLKVIPSEGAGKNDSKLRHYLKRGAAIGRKPLTCILVLQFLVVLFAIISVWVFLSAQYHNVINDREKERAILIATSLVRSDVEKLISSVSADQLFPEKEREDGVTSIILTDRLGNVKYPIDQRVEQVDYPSLIRSLMSRKLEITNLSDSQIRICNPVFEQAELSGFVIVDYHLRPSRSMAGNAGWVVLGGLLCFVFLVVSSAFLLRHVLFFPWRELAEKVSESLEKKHDRIELPESYQELTEIKTLFERLLVRTGRKRDNSGNAARRTISPIPGNKKRNNVGSEFESHGDGLNKDMISDEAPACIIDRETGHLIKYNGQFARIISVDREHQNHVIELFQDSGSVEGVLELLQKGAGSIPCIIDGNHMSLSGEPVKEKEGYIRIVIKEDDK